MDLESNNDIRVFKVTSASGDKLILVEKRKFAPTNKWFTKSDDNNDNELLEITSMCRLNLFLEEDFSTLCLFYIENSNVGCVHYHTTPNKLEFSSLLVKEEFRGKGYGKILVTALERTALSENLEFVEAGVRCSKNIEEVSDYNKRIKFYRDLNYIVKPAVINKNELTEVYNPIIKTKNMFLKAQCQTNIKQKDVSNKYKDEIEYIKKF